MHNVRAARRPRRLWSLVLLGCQLPFAGAAVAQDLATLASSARDNEIIEFEGLKLTSDVGKVYKGDLNELQQYREVYRLQLKRGEAAEFDLSSQVFDPMLKIMSADGSELSSNDDRAEDERDSRLVFAAPNDRGGTFYLVVTAVDKRSGDFLLTVTPRPAPATASAKPLVAGSPVRGKFDKASGLRIADQRLYSSYFFDAVADERVQIDAVGQLIPVDLELLHDGKVVKADMGSAANSSLFHRIAATGRYQVNVLANPESVGSFELRLKKLPKPRPPGPPTAVAVGETASGEFLDDSPRTSPLTNRPYALFQLTGAAGESVAIWATLVDPGESNPTDAYPISLDIGADTPAGFATVRTRSEPSPHVPGSRRVKVKFERPGPLLVRVSGRSGAVGRFTLATERLAAEAEAAAAATE